MNGIVFTEFIDLVEEKFGFDVADQMIEGSALPSGGAYTANGNYDPRELVRLVGQLSQETGVVAEDFLQLFGRHLFARFVGKYPEVFAGALDCFGFLAWLDGYINGTLNQMYLEAMLPQIEFIRNDAGTAELCYCSTFQLYDFVEGMIRGCVAHYQEPIIVCRELQTAGAETLVRFQLIHQGLIPEPIISRAAV